MKPKNNMGKRIGAVMTCIIILVTLASPVFSAAATVEAFDLFGALYSAYLVAHGLDPEFASNGILASDSDPISETSWRYIWEENFNYYAPLVDDTIESAVDWVEGYLQDLRVEKIFKNGSNTPPPSPDPDDNGVIGFQFTAQLSEFFDKLTNIILKDKYNLNATESGFEHSSGSFDAPLATYNNSLFPYQPLEFYNGTYYRDSNVYFYDGGKRSVFVRTNNAVNYVFFIGDILYGVNTNDISYTAIGYHKSGSGYNTFNVQTLDNTTGYRYGHTSSGFTVTDTNIPSFTTLEDALDTIHSGNTSEVNIVKLKPQDKYSNSPIPVPDTDDPDYLPIPQRIPLNVPYPESDAEPDFSDLSDPDANDFIQPVVETATENGLESPDPIITPEAPSSVMPPFLPSNIPPFNFNLSGIWYYVVRWIGSIRAGASFIFTILNNIPAAMFFPVFGTAVAVIVIGVWKRFFT